MFLILFNDKNFCSATKGKLSALSCNIRNKFIIFANSGLTNKRIYHGS